MSDMSASQATALPWPPYASSPHRPYSIAELAELATRDLWDPSKDLKHWLRAAERSRKAGRAYLQSGDLEAAFVELAKCCTIVLEKVPSDKEYRTLLTAAQRHNLGLNGEDVLKDLGEIKPILVDRYDRWAAQHPEEEAAIRAARDAGNNGDLSLDGAKWLAKEAVRYAAEQRLEDSRREHAGQASDALHGPVDAKIPEQPHHSQLDYTRGRNKEDATPAAERSGSEAVSRDQGRSESSGPPSSIPHWQSSRIVTDHRTEGRVSSDDGCITSERSLGKWGLDDLDEIRASFACDLTDYVTRDGEDPVAAGGFADIYRGTLRVRGRTIQVAIKSIKVYSNESDGLTQRTKRRLRREITVWVKLRHINVVPLFGTTSTFGKYPAMVCPWLENGTLTSFLEHHNNTLTTRAILLLINDVASGLHYLHSNDITHGDLSGSNVLIEENGRACLADFGLSTLLEELAGSTFVTTAKPRGTYRWAAPELLMLHESDGQGEARPTARSDIYSFGSVMLQILSGRVPYYYYLRDGQILTAISGGVTPKRPDDSRVTDRRWTFIQRCWSPFSKVELRPSSEDIVEFSGNEVSENSGVEIVEGNPIVPEVPAPHSNSNRTITAPGPIIPIPPTHNPPANHSASRSGPQIPPPLPERKPRYPTPITTTSPPPPEVHTRYPQLMSQHQLTQGYVPSLRSMFNYTTSVKPYNVGPSPALSVPDTAAIPTRPRVVGGLKTVLLPRDCLPRFLSIAVVNTSRNRQMCGLLLGKDRKGDYVVTTLLIPKQHSTSDTCTMDEEGLVLQFTEARALITLGWICTHPSQSCFMSSPELHTHSGFQRRLPESFVVICAPKSTPNFGIFRLTDPPGLPTILGCTNNEAFHPHPDLPLYTDADNGHVDLKDLAMEIVDLR